VQLALMNVRFERNNGHDADVTRCLLLTQSRHAANDNTSCGHGFYLLTGYGRSSQVLMWIKDPFAVFA